jgi:hypothetical protein
MVKLMDSNFVLGSALVVAALLVAAAAITRDDLPIIGTGAGALLAVAALGIAGCAVAGISQAPVLGWTSPIVIVGTVLGVLALLVITAGLAGWTGVLAPIAQFVPGHTAAVAPATTATLALAVVIGVKWAIAIAMAATAR